MYRWKTSKRMYSHILSLMGITMLAAYFCCVPAGYAQESTNKQNTCINITSGVHNMRRRPQSKTKSQQCYQFHDLPHNAMCRPCSAKKHHKVSRAAAKPPQQTIFTRKTCKQWLHKSPPPVASKPWLKGAHPVL